MEQKDHFLLQMNEDLRNVLTPVLPCLRCRRSVYIWKVAENDVEDGLEEAHRLNGGGAPVGKGEGTTVRLFNVDRWSKKKKASKGETSAEEDFNVEDEEDEEPKSKKKKAANKKGKK